MTVATTSTTKAAPARAAAVRSFGRYQLLQLLGKSERTMAWRVADPRSGQDLVLVLPRQQPTTSRGAGRLDRRRAQGRPAEPSQPGGGGRQRGGRPLALRGLRPA
jgi:hypothetical protein